MCQPAFNGGNVRRHTHTHTHTYTPCAGRTQHTPAVTRRHANKHKHTHTPNDKGYEQGTNGQGAAREKEGEPSSPVSSCWRRRRRLWPSGRRRRTSCLRRAPTCGSSSWAGGERESKRRSDGVRCTWARIRGQTANCAAARTKQPRHTAPPPHPTPELQWLPITLLPGDAAAHTRHERLIVHCSNLPGNLPRDTGWRLPCSGRAGCGEPPPVQPPAHHPSRACLTQGQAGRQAASEPSRMDGESPAVSDTRHKTQQRSAVVTEPQFRRVRSGVCHTCTHAVTLSEAWQGGGHAGARLRSCRTVEGVLSERIRDGGGVGPQRRQRSKTNGSQQPQ